MIILWYIGVFIFLYLWIDPFKDTAKAAKSAATVSANACSDAMLIQMSIQDEFRMRELMRNG